MIDNQDDLLQTPGFFRHAALYPQPTQAEAVLTTSVLATDEAIDDRLARRLLGLGGDRRGRSFDEKTKGAVSAASSGEATIVIVCGLEAEAKIARAPGSIVIVAGRDRCRLQAELSVAAPSARGIVSFGLAGGLAPGMRPGDTFVAEAIATPRGRECATHQEWSAAMAAALQAPLCAFAGVDNPLKSSRDKSALHESTGALTADMESHIVAEAAEHYRLPLAAVRVVTDPAEHTLPHAATVGMGLDGHLDKSAVLRSLARRPGQIPNLIRTALDARMAFAALLRCRQRLGPRFALFDLG